jgi:hypothetical protein
MPTNKEENEKLPCIYDFYIDSIKGLTDKMTPSDYMYLSDMVFNFKGRVDEIQKRK